MERPIMLWITSRSRSSMISSMFIKHGVWWGDTIARQEWVQEDGSMANYISYENQNIKQILKKYKTCYWFNVHLTPVSPKWNRLFETDLAEILPTDKTWMMKTGVEYFNAFKDLNPYNIFIKRNPADVAQSLCNKRPGTNYKTALHAANWRFDYMDKLQEQYGGVCVDTDKIVGQGDFSEVKEAIEYCGLEYNEESAIKAITR